MPGLGQLFLTIAILALFHSAFSTFEHLSHWKALSKPEKSIPSSIVFESLVALFLGIIGACLRAPPLKEITWASEMKTRTIDDMDSRMDFANFVTRGSVLGREKLLVTQSSLIQPLNGLPTLDAFEMEAFVHLLVGFRRAIREVFAVLLFGIRSFTG